MEREFEYPGRLHLPLPPGPQHVGMGLLVWDCYHGIVGMGLLERLAAKHDHGSTEEGTAAKTSGGPRP